MLRVWIVDLWFGFGFLMNILRFLRLYFCVVIFVCLVVICVVNGVDLCELWKFELLDVVYVSVLFEWFVIVIIVLLKDVWI